MKQPGFFDLDQRHKKLVKTRGFLENLNRFVAWESFRALLDEALKRSSGAKGGRPAHDAVLMFKVLVLQALYNLSDEQTEYQILDRLSFMKFLGLELCDDVPDARTIWLFRETLRKAGAVEKLFAQFDAMLNQHGFQASGGQIVDATFAGRRAKETIATITQRSRTAKFPMTGAIRRRRTRTPMRAGRRKAAWPFTATKTMSMWIASTN
jgi:hypothetical protein